ncbi:MAG: hypothetical protein AABZ80_05400 [Gemmatimonadota bacterium]
MIIHLAAALVAAVSATSMQADSALALRPTSYMLDLTVDHAKRELRGSATIVVRNVSTAPVRDASFLLYRLMRVSAVADSAGTPLAFRASIVEFEDHATLHVRHVVVRLRSPLAPGGSATVRLDYAGPLAGYTETGMLYIRDRVDTAFSIVREDANAYPTVRVPSHAVNGRSGLPAYDYHARIRVPTGYTVANGGRLVSASTADGWTTFEFTNVKPAWRMDFAVARFNVRAQGGLRVYSLPEDSAGAVRVLDAMSRTLALYTRWFGPLRGSADFALIEIPDGWGSQADVSSVLQTAAVFRDPRRQYELYHELSHLWNVPFADVPSPRWNEGLATFLEDITIDSLEGRMTTDKAADQTVLRLRDEVRARPTLGTVAPVDYGRERMTGSAYTVPSVMFYVMYRLMGHDAFTRLIAEYYRQYGASGATTRDFASLASKLSPVPLDRLFDEWMFSARWAGVIANTAAADLPARYRPGAAGGPEATSSSSTQVVEAIERHQVPRAEAREAQRERRVAVGPSLAWP